MNEEKNKRYTCEDCRFHEPIKSPIEWCSCLNKKAPDHHKWLMKYSHDKITYDHDIPEMQAETYKCPYFEIRLRSYDEIKKILEVVVNDRRSLVQNTMGSWKPLFSADPYGEGHQNGFVDALYWVLYEYKIKAIEVVK